MWKAIKLKDICRFTLQDFETIQNCVFTQIKTRTNKKGEKRMPTSCNGVYNNSSLRKTNKLLPLNMKIIYL
jgi:hypothetical protein